MHTIATIGYEAVTLPAFLEALQDGDVRIVADIRAVAGSRRPGFSKSRLAAALADVGIDYVHLRGLGTPADGRAAAKSGDYAALRRIYLEHLATEKAQVDMESLVQLIEAGRRVCLLCYEAQPEHCHRSLVAAALVSRLGVDVVHLHADVDAD